MDGFWVAQNLGAGRIMGVSVPLQLWLCRALCVLLSRVGVLEKLPWKSS